MALSVVQAPVAIVGSTSENLKQQVEFCLSDVYVALCKVLQSSTTKDALKGTSVPLSVIVNTLPTTEAKLPETASVRAALLSLTNVKIDENDIVTCHGLLSPNSNRIRECRRKSVVVDGIPANSTPESIRELLAGCGRVVSAGVCHPRHTALYVKGAFLSKSVHGIAQFSTVQEAVNAVSTMNFSWRGGPRVTHLMKEFRPPSPLRPRNQNATRETPTPTDSSSNDGSTNGDTSEDCDALENVARKRSRRRPKKNRAKSNFDSPKLQGFKKVEAHVVKDTKKDAEAQQAVAAPENRLHPRRFVNSRSPIGAPGVPVADGIRPRIPRGPDGTRGFAMGRGRPLVVAV